MRIGLDFGTTRVVVAAVNRGNYPVVGFETPDGDSQDWLPPVVAVRGEERRYGFDAWRAQQEPGWVVVRSVKRLLGEAGLETRVELGEQTLSVQVLLSELAEAIGRALREHSTLAIRKDEPFEVMLGVPANANSNQRFLTAEGFRAAGFHVLGMLNEPSAASIELGHRMRAAGNAPKHRSLLVYDFGGGTFDASLVRLDDQVHDVVDWEGLTATGGDDFDAVLGDMALEAAGTSPEAREGLADAALFRLHELCRSHKESLHANSRRIVLDLGSVDAAWPLVTLSVADYVERCQPLVERTLAAVDSLLARQGADAEGDLRRPDIVYVIGGASELPMVGRRLRERFGRHVRRSPYGRSSTAIGLAIQADVQAGYVLRDRFTRYFGVWREADSGATAVFDPLFTRGAALPRPGDPALTVSRTYRPAHNLGHFRFLECSQLAPGGEPAGDILHWDDIRFPFVPALSERADLSREPVRLDADAGSQEIIETFACDAGGSVVVTLSNVGAGYARRYPLGHWGGRATPIKAARRPRPRNSN